MYSKREILSLEVQEHPYVTYLWNTGDTTPSILVSKSGTYVIEVQFGDSIYSDSVEVKVESCDVTIPNIITPNNDSINERFIIPRNNEFQYYLKVYNRWGKLVYQEENYQSNWNGEGLIDGIYFYHIMHSRINQVYTGWLQILR